MDRLPLWCNADGVPKSWEHFQVGLTRLTQLDYRNVLRSYDATRMAQVVEEDARKDWTAKIRRQAGL